MADEKHFEVDFDVAVVIPASGSGERFGQITPKQYCLLLDEPLILHAISAFHRILWVRKIVVVVEKKYVQYLKQLQDEHKLNKLVVAEGGSTRHRSIAAGTRSLAQEPPDVVIIHDGVRPFVDETVVRKIAWNAKKYGAAGVSRPLVSTVIAADSDGFLQESLDRRRYVASEMPQGFQYDVIKTAYEKANEEDLEHGTECLLLAMKHTGTKAKIIPGPDNLWKVTYRKDLFAAEALLKEEYLSARLHFVDHPKNKPLFEAVSIKCRNKGITVRDSINEQSHPCNNNIFIYSDFNLCGISETTKQVKNLPNHDRGTHGIEFKQCVIQVLDSQSLETSEMNGFIQDVSGAAKHLPNCIVYGILHHNGQVYAQLSDMIANLIWNRDESLSGQTFVINRDQENNFIQK